MMEGDKNASWRRKRQAERNRNLLMVFVPLMIVVLIAVIAWADRSKKANETDDNTLLAANSTLASDGNSDLGNGMSGEGSGAAGTSDPAAAGGSDAGMGDFETGNSETGNSGTEGSDAAASGESGNSENADDPDNAGTGQEYTLLKKDEIPQINDLMETFWKARIACDAETVYKLYGRTDTNGIEEFRAKMLNNAREIRSLGDIACYTMAGMDEKSWLVYAVVEFTFRNAEPVVPIGTKYYVTEDEEGNFILVDPEQYSPELKKFIEQADRLDEVRNLSAQANKRTLDAIQSDSQLVSLFGTLNAGSPLWGTHETEAPPQIQVLPES